MKAGYFIALVVTAAASGAAGWYASKVYYDKKAQKVIETGRDPIREEKEPEKVEEPVKKEMGPIPSFRSPEEKVAHYNSVKSIYTQALEKHNYTIPEDDPADQAPAEKPSAPYVVTSAEWGECNAYEKVDLVYYEQDGILADYDNNIIDENEVGDDFKEHFDENDIAYVRNDQYSRDYEITSDPRSYREIATGEP